MNTIGGSGLPLMNYSHLIDTFVEQAGQMITEIDGQDANSLAGAYIEAEQTQRFIREEAQEPGRFGAWTNISRSTPRLCLRQRS